MDNRINSIDYLKCIFIILMIIFHLAYIGDRYPYLKQIVYTFHMPAFLILSGYLANTQKESRLFLFSMIWIFIPYAIMETGYVLMSAVLPVRERIESISIPLILNKVFFTPMGPYWYLHTLIICYTMNYMVNKICSRMNVTSFFILLGVCFWVLSEYLKILSMANALYFIIGVGINRYKQNFISVFQPSAFGLLPFIVLCYYPVNLNRYSLAGVVITYLSISFSLWVYHYLPKKIKSLTQFIGRSTLPILLFSPIFTITSKVFIPIFSFDSSGLCFMCVATTFVIIGSLSIAWAMDKISWSLYFCGRKNLVQR